jgi:hypothetical protein
MKTGKLLITALVKPRSFIGVRSYSKISDPEKIRMEDIRITALRPNDYDDFEIFKKIITNEDVAFAVPRIDQCFDNKILRQKCYHTKEKLRLIDEGDSEIVMPEEVLSAYRSGISPAQIALDRFFTVPTNKTKLREIYLEMTGRAEETGLGYYKLEDASGRLLGGGALAPISGEGNPEMVDVALHILEARRGIGSFCLNKLLTKAFEEHGVKQVWGSSIINHPGTPTLCAKHGMMIKNQDGLKYYFIDSDMWKTNKDKLGIMDDPRAASTTYGRIKDKGERGEGR